MMEVRNLKNSDYPTLCKWWAENRFPIIPIDDLPVVNSEIQGLIVCNSEFEICAGFIIDTTIKNGLMMEYIVANFEVKDKKLRKEALNFLIESICRTAKLMNKKYIFSSLKHPSLLNRYKDCGFVEGSINTTEMIKVL